MKIQLINLGRNKVNKTIIVKNEKAMWREISKYIMSKGIDLMESDEPDKFYVYAGIRNVGEVIIKDV